MIPAEPAAIQGWHAHVYYDPQTTRETASLLRGWVEARFEVTMGRWHDVKVGPHPQAMFQIAFSNAVFPDLAAFLALNRMGLTVLLHPNTLNDYLDHSNHALWLGQILPLDLSVLSGAD